MLTSTKMYFVLCSQNPQEYKAAIHMLSEACVVQIIDLSNLWQGPSTSLQRIHDCDLLVATLILSVQIVYTNTQSLTIAV